jgi:hypothetical protein
MPARWGRSGTKTLLDALRDGDFRLHFDCLDAVFTCRYGAPHEIAKRVG